MLRTASLWSRRGANAIFEERRFLIHRVTRRPLSDFVDYQAREQQVERASRLVAIRVLCALSGAGTCPLSRLLGQATRDSDSREGGDPDEEVASRCGGGMGGVDVENHVLLPTVELSILESSYGAGWWVAGLLRLQFPVQFWNLAAEFLQGAEGLWVGR